MISFVGCEQVGSKVERKTKKANVRMRVFIRDNFQCQGEHCNEINNLTVDHILPLSQGGADDLLNMQTLCYRCNQRKRNSIPRRIRQYSGPVRCVVIPNTDLTEWTAICLDQFLQSQKKETEEEAKEELIDILETDNVRWLDRPRLRVVRTNVQLVGWVIRGTN